MRNDLLYGRYDQVFSTGAIEKAQRALKDQLKHRAFSLRNLFRTNQILELRRLHMNRVDDVDTYMGLLGEHLTTPGNGPPTQGQFNDPFGQSSLHA